MNHILGRAFLGLLCLGFPVEAVCAQAQAEDPRVVAALRLVEQITSPWDEDGPGGAIAVIIDDRIAFERGFGMADVERATPFTPGTVVEAASITKQFTGVAVRALQRDGLLNTEAPVGSYWSELAPSIAAVSAEQLLAHTGGVPDPSQLLSITGLTWHDAMTQEQAKRLLTRSSTTLFPPGTRFSYSNGGYVLLAELVDRRRPEGFSEWLRTRVFQPLNMDDTHVHSEYGHAQPAMATGYRRDGDRLLRSPNNTGIYGDGGMRTTLHDLALWVAAFGSGAWFPESEAEWRNLEAHATDGTPVGYGDGLFIDELSGQLRIGHGGRTGSFVSYLGYIPALRCGVVVLANGFPNQPQLDPWSVGSEVLTHLIQAAGETPGPNRTPQGNASPSVSYSGAPAARDQIPGTYWHREQNYLRWIDDRAGQFIYRRANGSESPLVEHGDGWTMMGVQTDVRLAFTAIAPDSVRLAFTIDDGPPSHYVRVDPYEPTQLQLDSLAGVFIEPSLLATLRVRREGDRLAIDHPVRKTEYLVPTVARTFNAAPPYWSECNDTGCWLGSLIRFEESASGGLRLRLVNDASDLMFQRVEGLGR